MRAAIVKGTLQIPPTYFAIEHALQRPDVDWRLFALAANIRGVQLPGPVSTPLPQRFGYRTAEIAKYAAAKRLQHLIERAAPDIVHQHMLTWTTSAVRASRRLHIPLVTTIHGTDAYLADAPGNHPLVRINRNNARAGLSASTRLLAVSRYIADVAIRHGAPRERMQVLYQGVDTEFFTPQPSEDDRTWWGEVTSGQVPVVLYVGSLSEQKGIPGLLAASIALQPSIAHELVLIGGGPLAAQVLQASSAHPHIRVLGALSRHRVRAAMRHATVLTLPTRTWQGRQEAAGLVLLEAQACGCPVITNAVGGTKEMVSIPDSWIVDEHDAAAFSRALGEALSEADTPAARERQQAVRAFVTTHRAAAHSADQLIALYQELCH